MLRIHYSADPDKDPLTDIGQDWYREALRGKPGGFSGPGWQSEMEISFNVFTGKPVYAKFSVEAHVAKEPIKPVRGIPMLRGIDGGLCYSDDTEVLTYSGWKFIKDVDERCDRVATRNPETGEMTFSGINFKVAEPYEGELLEWSSWNVNFCVTPEHVVPFTYRDTPKKVCWASAEWLEKHITGHHFVDIVAKWTQRDLPDPSQTLGMDPIVYAEFMGIFLSEGCVHQNKTRVCQKYRSPYIQRILDATGLKWVWAETTSGNYWEYCSKDFTDKMRPFGKQPVRYIPQVIKDMPRELIERFIVAYTVGDGSTRDRPGNGEEHTIVSTSKRIVDDLQELASKMGWTSSLSWKSPHHGVITEKGVKRTIMGNGAHCIRFKKRSPRAELLKANFKRVPYSGMVYCLNVPYHTLLIRRKGVPSWNGNTPACSFSQLTNEPRWLIFPSLHTTGREGVGMTRFGQEFIAYSAMTYPGFSFINYCDPACFNRAETDERSNAMILGSMNIHVIPGVTGSMTRDEIVRVQLERMIDGKAFVQVCPTATFDIQGFSGGFQYKQIGQTNIYMEVHDKNEWSHAMEATQYVASRIFDARDPQGRTNRRDKGGFKNWSRKPKRYI